MQRNRSSRSREARAVFVARTAFLSFLSVTIECFEGVPLLFKSWPVSIHHVYLLRTPSCRV